MTIQEVIKESKLTQKAFSEKYGIPKRTVENWAEGKAVPPEYIPNLIKKLMDYENERKP